MFEHVMLTGSPKGKRVWTTCAGVTGQMVLVAGMVVAPMLWPQAMPQAVFTMLVPAVPQGQPANAKPEAKREASVTPTIRKKYQPGLGLTQPIVVPEKIEIVTDFHDATGPVGVTGVPYGDPYGRGNPVLTGILEAAPTVRREEKAEGPAETVKPPVAAIRRVTEGGLVNPARLIYRVEPRYPQLARISRIEGVVKLRGVIAIDGNIAELAVESGHPLLAPAALEAVRQWRYAPTLLNSVPVEVVTVIAVTFTLNR